MARAGVGLITSEREGMPVALKEALAAGLRVLAVGLPLWRVAAAFPHLIPSCRLMPWRWHESSTGSSRSRRRRSATAPLHSHRCVSSAGPSRRAPTG